MGSLAVGSPGSILAGSRLEAHSWRNEELGGKDNKVLGSTQAEESVLPPREVAEGSGTPQHPNKVMSTGAGVVTGQIKDLLCHPSPGEGSGTEKVVTEAGWQLF